MGGIIRIDDMLGSVQAAAAVAALTTEQYRDTGFSMPFFRHDQDDALHLTFQFSHRKRLGSNLASVHIHCIPMVSPAAPENVYFGYNYTWQNADGTFPANASWVSGNSTMTVGISDGFDGRLHSIIADIEPPASEGYSSFLLVTITRLGTDGNDTYDTAKVGGTAQANLGLLGIDCHYETNRRGSIEELTD